MASPAKNGAGGRGRNDLLVVIGLSIAFLAWAWWTNVPEAEIKSVLDGFSPIDWVHQLAQPGNFASNFPSGIENYDKSLPMLAYPMLFQAFGIDPARVLPVFIGVELLVFSLATTYLVRTILPHVPLALALLVVVLAVGSWTRTMDLGRFGGPYFWGLFYNVADALRLVGIALALRQRWLLSGLVMGLACATHTTMGLIGVAFIAFAVLGTPRRLATRAPWLGVLMFTVIAGGWIAYSFRSAAVVVSDIPPSDWLTLTRMFSYHWYPVANGILSTERHVALVPLLSFVLLALFYLPRAGVEPALRRQLFAGVAGLLTLAVAGLVFSSALPSPTLIKLALQRSSDLVVLVALPVVAWGLLREVTDGHWLRALAAGALLLSPFVVRPGFPVLLSLALALPALVALKRAPEYSEDRVTAWLAVLILSYLGVAHVVWGRIGADEITNASAFLPAVGVLLALVFGFRRLPQYRWAAPLVFSLCAVAFSANLLHEKRPTWRAPAAVAYREAQEWARANTPGPALFLVDPTIFYGWRDYSQRSSFGNLREWAHTSWLYDSKSDRYREGLRRLSEFGLSPFEYAGRQDIAVNDHVDLAGELQKRFYGAGDEEIRAIAARNGVDYVVTQKAMESRRRSFPIVFENSQYVVYSLADKGMRTK